MSQVSRSKREQCPKCDSVLMNNYVQVRPGEDSEVFVECSQCQAFVARYTLRAYTCDDPYRSYLRLMRSRRMASGVAARDARERFTGQLWEHYRQVKQAIVEHEEQREIEDLLNEAE